MLQAIRRQLAAHLDGLYCAGLAVWTWAMRYGQPPAPHTGNVIRQPLPKTTAETVDDIATSPWA
jgi:hypothetical protein